MIHDILFCLLNPKAENSVLQQFLDTDYISVYLHPCEKKILEDILEIVGLHREILNCINLLRSDAEVDENLTDDGEDFSPKSLYFQAFASGVETALHGYDAEIVNLEKSYLQSPSHTLMFIFHKINHYKPLLGFLKKLICDLKLQRFQGCAVFQYLNKNVLNGNHEIHLAVKAIHLAVNNVFLKHLTHWILFAKMLDSYGEFFIQHTEAKNNGSSLMENYCLSSGGSEKQTVTSFSEAVSTYEDIWRYEICFEYLPPFITPNLARKILFIGQTVLMFKMEAAKKRTELWNQCDDKTTEGSLWNNMEHKYFKKIQNLQNENNLRVSQVDYIINDIKSFITSRLWQIAVNQADLVHQLKLVKDFFLLGRGELFLEFIKKTQTFGTVAKSENMVRDIVLAFETAAIGIGLTEELEQFSMSIPKEKLNDSQEKNFPYIRFLTLHYKITWPLHLLFSPKVIDRYNDLFRFLVEIKRLQFSLHQIWCTKRRRKIKSNLFRLHIRNQFMFLIDNLQYYIQVDVLESQFSILMNVVQHSFDFEEIQRAHSIFQANILHLCFLLGNNNNEQEYTLYTENTILSILQELFYKCEEFIELEKDREENYEKNQPKYTALESSLNDLVQQLINLLSNLKSAPCSTPLSQLLLRLNYNNWFTSQNRNIGKEN